MDGGDTGEAVLQAGDQSGPGEQQQTGNSGRQEGAERQTQEQVSKTEKEKKHFTQTYPEVSCGPGSGCFLTCKP